MGCYHGVHDRQTEPRAPTGPGAGGVPARESLEHVRQKVRGDAGTVVMDFDDGPGIQLPDPTGDGGAAGSVGAGIGQDVGEDLVQPVAVGVDGDGIGGQFEDPAVTDRRRRGFATGLGHIVRFGRAAENKWDTLWIVGLLDFRQRPGPATRLTHIVGVGLAI